MLSFLFLATQTDETAAALPPMVVMILVVCVLGIGVIFLLYTRSRIESRNAQIGTPRERIDEIKQRAESDGELNASMTELLDMSRRLAAQLDNKAERLEQLLAEADARITAMGGLAASVAAAGSGGAGGVSHSNGHRAASSTGSEPDLAGEKLEHLARETTGDESSDDSIHDQIHRLADDGYSPVEIAQRLDEQTGKVELVLALRKK